MPEAIQDLTAVHDNPAAQLGTIHWSQGKAYIYGKGIGSTLAGSWVSMDEDCTTALLAANAKGRVGVAMAAIIANKYGWYQIFGKHAAALTADDVADNGDLYATATAGKVDDAVVAGDRIKGAWAREAGTGADAIAVELAFPFVDDMADA